MAIQLKNFTAIDVKYGTKADMYNYLVKVIEEYRCLCREYVKLEKQVTEGKKHEKVKIRKKLNYITDVMDLYTKEDLRDSFDRLYEEYSIIYSEYVQNNKNARGKLIFQTMTLDAYNKTGLQKSFNELYEEYNCIYPIYVANNKNNKDNGGSNMLNMNSLFEGFGKIENGSVALTYSGEIAVKRNNNEYVRYNKETDTMENQMDMVLKEASDLIFILPVDKVTIGDIIKHKETYYQILGMKDNGSLRAVNIKDGTKKTIIKETNIVGFNFYYKVVSLFSQGDITNNTTNGIDPNILMLLSSGDTEESNDLLPLLLMSSMNGTSSSNTINPMMLMMMSKGKEKSSNIKDLLMLQMMSGKDNQTINPMMLMMMSDGKMDVKSLMLMNMLNNKQQQ